MASLFFARIMQMSQMVCSVIFSYHPRFTGLTVKPTECIGKVLKMKREVQRDGS